MEDDNLLLFGLVGVDGREAAEVFIVVGRVAKHVISGVLMHSG